MLLSDEQYVVKWLSQYGALPKTQVVRLLRDKSPATAEKIIRNLKKEMRIADVGGGYYLGLDNLCKPDQRLILAIWVLLKFIGAVDPMAHYPATYPAQIFFLKGNIGYEIVVIYDGEQHLSKLLQPQDEDMKYILVSRKSALWTMSRIHYRLPSQNSHQNAPCVHRHRGQIANLYIAQQHHQQSFNMIKEERQ